VATKERAGFPAPAVCAKCHQSSEGVKPVPAHPVYVLPDFVFFSHATHAKGGVRCAECHGNVSEMNTIEKTVSLRMMWCVNCHKQADANVACNACHELSQ
jgi:hypothetical protein